MVDEVLAELSPRFTKMYAKRGRPSIAPERLLRGLLLQVLYTIRSERQLMEQLDYNLLYRWFVGLAMDEEVWDATVFSKNRERLVTGDIAQAFFAAVVEQARSKDLLSDEHFTVDGSLLEAWASEKSYQKKEKPPEKGSGSRGELRLRDTHECKTDPDAMLYKKSAGGESKLRHMVHVTMENRTGLPVAARATQATTQAEWEAAVEMLKATTGGRRCTVGADTGYDTEWFVKAARAIRVTPHVTQHTRRATQIDGRTTRHEGYEISLRKRKSVEHIFSWVKNVANLRKVRLRGR
jgi:transposase